MRLFFGLPMKFGSLLFLHAILFVIGFGPSVGLAEEGRQLYTDKQCNVCHGKSGKERIRGMPRLSGQKKRYLVAQIEDIVRGKRDNNYSQLMRMNYTLEEPIKESSKKRLTKGEIDKIANFLKERKQSR